MAMTIIVEPTRSVTGGVDTHLDVHVAAVLNEIGGLLATESFDANRAGEDSLVGWMESFGLLACVGVEGTGSYGAGLARLFAASGIKVVEVDRPNRQVRRRQGKSDTLDAIEAARAAQSGRATGHAKSRDGNAEAIRALIVARRSARSTKTKSLNQIRHLGFTAPNPLRERLSGLTAARLAVEAASLRPRPGPDTVTFATKTSLRILGRRVLAINAELVEIDALLSELVAATAPQLGSAPDLVDILTARIGPRLKGWQSCPKRSLQSSVMRSCVLHADVSNHCVRPRSISGSLSRV